MTELATSGSHGQSLVATMARATKAGRGRRGGSLIGRDQELAYAGCGLPAEAAVDHLRVAELLPPESSVDSLAHIRAARDAARSTGRTDLEARALALEGFAFLGLGRQKEATKRTQAALSLALAGKHVEAAVDAYWVLGTIAAHWADYKSAEAAFIDAAELCRKNDMEAGEHVCLSCLALVLYNRGEWQQAEKLAKDLLASAAGEGAAKAHALCALGFISAARGATKRAQSLLRRALAIGHATSLRGTVLESMVGLALVQELEGSKGRHWGACAFFCVSVGG